MDRNAIFLLEGSQPNRVQIGPFTDEATLDRWLDTLRRARVSQPAFAGVGIVAGAFEPAAALDPATAPATAADLIQVFDEWESGVAYGADLLDLRTVLECVVGADEAAKVWGEAEERTGGTAPSADRDARAVFSDRERDRIADLINTELAVNEGRRDDGDSDGHVAFDTVMHELYLRAEDRPGGPGRVVMAAVLEWFGTVWLLDGLADGPRADARVPFSDNVRRSAEQIEDVRALLTEMLCFGSAHIESALARAGLVTVSVSDLEQAGVPSDVVAKLRARMEAHE